GGRHGDGPGGPERAPAPPRTGTAPPERVEGVVYIIPIEGTIDEGLAVFVRRALREAREAGAAAVLVEINTFGGRVDSATDIKDGLAAMEVPVIAFVTQRAWSAGALIALGARYLAMAPGIEKATRTQYPDGIAPHRTIARTDEGFAAYRFDLMTAALYDFTWHEYCDWYLELTKPLLQGEDAAQAAATRRTLLDVLEALLRALHPVMPFITEEIWRRVAPVAGVPGDTIMLAPWPAAGDYTADAAATADVDWMKSVILGIRQIR